MRVDVASFDSSEKTRREIERRGSYLTLQNVDLAILDVHMIFKLGQFGVHAIALLLRLHRRLRLLLNHSVFLLESLSHLLDLRDRTRICIFNREK